MKLFVILAVAVSAFLSTSAMAGSLQATPATPAHVRLTTNSTLARFVVTGDVEQDVQLTQIAFGVTARSWIYHQVVNVRLFDENGTVLTDPKRVWSTPIMCDCDSGRVIFDTVTNLIIPANGSRMIRVVADFVGDFELGSEVTVTYQHADSRLVGLVDQVNSTLVAIPNVSDEKFTGVVARAPIVAADFAQITRFSLQTIPNTTDKGLVLGGFMEPNTSYTIEASTNLVHWEQVGVANSPGDSEVLKEQVGVIGEKYRDRAFFRMKKRPTP